MLYCPQHKRLNLLQEKGIPVNLTSNSFQKNMKVLVKNLAALIYHKII